MDDRIDLTIQQREAVEAELDRRTLAHKRRVGRIRRGAQLRAQRRTKAKKPKAAPQQAAQLDFLAIGDSWFDYPLNGNDISLTNTAIAAQLTQVGNPPPLVLNYALYGQATTAVLTYENQQRSPSFFGNFSIDNLSFAGSTIPEPSTWAMMLIGFSGLGCAGLSRVAKGRRCKSRLSGPLSANEGRLWAAPLIHPT